MNESYMNRVSAEVEVRKEKDLEEKRERLTARFYETMQKSLGNEGKPQDSFLWSKYERIVYDNTELIEGIFKSTEDFYDAAALYESHVKDIAKKFDLEEDGRLRLGESAEDNLKKFHQSIDCQKNLSRAHVLAIEARSHESRMLLELDGLQFLRDRDIKDVSDTFKTHVDVRNEKFAAKLHGLLSKVEAQARIGKENVQSAIFNKMGEVANRAEEISSE